VGVRRQGGSSWLPAEIIIIIRIRIINNNFKKKAMGRLVGFMDVEWFELSLFLLVDFSHPKAYTVERSSLGCSPEGLYRNPSRQNPIDIPLGNGTSIAYRPVEIEDLFSSCDEI
jgi:hypothetical protein